MFKKIKTDGFTLIEMTVVVGLVAILAMLVMPNMGNITDKAKTVVSDLNEKTIQQQSIMGTALGDSVPQVSELADINDIGDIQDITVNYTGSDSLYLLVSTDGSTWYSYRDELNISMTRALAGKEKIPVDITKPKNIKKKGLNLSVFNNLTATDWSNIIENANKLSFAYYLEDAEGNNITKTANPDLSVNITGTNKTKTVELSSSPPLDPELVGKEIEFTGYKQTTWEVPSGVSKIKLEVWGGQGGHGGDGYYVGSNGTRGDYTTGIIENIDFNSLKITVGEQGGRGNSDSGYYAVGGPGGGGASSGIRIEETNQELIEASGGRGGSGGINRYNEAYGGAGGGDGGIGYAGGHDGGYDAYDTGQGGGNNYINSNYLTETNTISRENSGNGMVRITIIE